MLKDKSTRNLAACEALRALGLTDAAATRYYFALYQAAVHRLKRLGWTPGSIQVGGVEWDHDIVMRNVYLVRRRRSDGDLYKVIRVLRLRADYADVSVEAPALANRVEAVRKFVEEATS